MSKRMTLSALRLDSFVTSLHQDGRTIDGGDDTIPTVSLVAGVGCTIQLPGGDGPTYASICCPHNPDQ